MSKVYGGAGMLYSLFRCHQSQFVIIMNLHLAQRIRNLYPANREARRFQVILYASLTLTAASFLQLLHNPKQPYVFGVYHIGDAHTDYAGSMTFIRSIMSTSAIFSLTAVRLSR